MMETKTIRCIDCGREINASVTRWEKEGKKFSETVPEEKGWGWRWDAGWVCPEDIAKADLAVKA
jgi:hypothetical protein